MSANTKTRALIDKARSLPVDQQMLLVEAVTLGLYASPLPVTQEQIDEIQRRGKYYDEHPEELIPGEVAMKNARAALKKHRNPNK